MVCVIADPNNNLALVFTLTLEESRNNLRAMAAPLSVGNASRHVRGTTTLTLETTAEAQEEAAKAQTTALVASRTG
jgi:hypothetical protein